jgi:hypothetical protein
MKNQKTIIGDERPKTYRADIEVPARGICVGRLVHVDLNEEETASVQATADKAEMTLDAFIREIVGNKPERLMPWAKNHDRKPVVAIKKVEFGRMSQRDLMRVKRTAKYEGLSMLRFMAEAVAAAVEGWEDDMVVHPETGEVIGSGDDVALLRRNSEYLEPARKETGTSNPAPVAEPFTLKLSPQAVRGVLDYEKATGFGLDEDDWRVRVNDVMEAARLRKKGGAR